MRLPVIHRRRLTEAALSLLLIFTPTPLHARQPPTCRSTPLSVATLADQRGDRSLGLDLDAILRDAVKGGITHSAALAVMHRGKLIYRGGAGGATSRSLFDLASLTKVMATAPSVMILAERGQLALKERASRHLPLLAAADKREITPLQLLTHTAGFHSVVWAGKLTDGKPVILERIRRARLKSPPGDAYRYSDVGYISLGELVAAVSGAPLHRFAEEHIFRPLGMCDTLFNPPPELHKKLRTPWPNGEQIGVVYDPLAARMGGVAGNAGLYSTAEDLARFGQAMLQGGRLGRRRVMSAKTVAEMTRPRRLPGARGARGLGWDTSSAHASSKGRLSARAYGHTGFTGTSLWIDPEHELVVALLTNRTYMPRARSVSPLRRTLHNVILTALPRAPARRVETGLDRLFSQRPPLRGDIGVITNHTARDAEGRWIVNLLLLRPEVRVRAIFTPEHGIKAKREGHLKDSRLRFKDQRIPLYSLFGSRRRPTDKTLAGIETLVFDMDSVGVRYYTYLATMGWAMEEAARRGIRFWVLDRPDPIGGHAVQGPVSSEARRTSTNYHPTPVRYGMTVGELARMYNAERKIKAALTVIPLRGWRRGQLHSETGWNWVNPSPNIRSWRQALVYGGVGLLETTNLSVGRGTDSPFQLVGAPWIDGDALARRMNRRRLPGVQFLAAAFTPRARPYKGKPCQGLRLLITDARRINPPEVGVALAVTLRAMYPEQWETRNLYRLINHTPTTEAILQGKELSQITPLWRAGLKRFLSERKRYLLYR